MAKKRYITTTDELGNKTTRTEMVRTQGGCARFLGWVFILALAGSAIVWLVEHIAHLF